MGDELNCSQSGAEIGETNEDEVEDAWEETDVLHQQHLQSTPPADSLPEPTNAEEASTMLAKFLPNLSTPEHLRVLLEARADPNIVRGLGSPLDVVTTLAKREHVPSILSQRGPSLSYASLH